MNIILFPILLILAGVSFYLFIRGPYKYSPLWLMLFTWGLGLAIPQLNLSEIEKPWTQGFWSLIIISLASFTFGFFAFDKLYNKFSWKKHFRFLQKTDFSAKKLRIIICALVIISLVALYLFYIRAGNFPLLAADTDVFRFQADDEVPGLINYSAQLARLFIPLSFFLMLWEGFSFRKHWDISLISLIGLISLTLFASRTQIFFIDLWIMALYLFMRKPNLKQALKFYPVFLLISVLVLAVVPLYRQYKSYGTTDYLAGITAIDSTGFNPAAKALLPIYVGISFNQQSLLHAHEYYQTHPLQMGKVSLDPFTNILGLNEYGSTFNLCEIFQCWWNTGTYLFPFVQDFGNSAFYWVPFMIAGFLTTLWHYWKAVPNFLSINYYAYACFFIVMTIYLSFTVRAEMYMDIAFLFISYLFVTKR